MPWAFFTFFILFIAVGCDKLIILCHEKEHLSLAACWRKYLIDNQNYQLNLYLSHIITLLQTIVRLFSFLQYWQFNCPNYCLLHVLVPCTVNRSFSFIRFYMTYLEQFKSNYTSALRSLERRSNGSLNEDQPVIQVRIMEKQDPWSQVDLPESEH